MALRRVALSAAHAAAHRGPPLLSRSPLLSAASAHRSAAVERFAGAQVLFRHATTAATRGTGAVANVPAAGAAGVRRVGARRAADEMRALSKRSFSSDGGGGSGAKSKSADTAKTSPAEPSTSASGSASSSTAAEATAEPMTLSLMWERYGVIAIATHFGVYFATLAGLYGGVSAGLMGQGDEKKEAVEKVGSSADLSPRVARPPTAAAACHAACRPTPTTAIRHLSTPTTYHLPPATCRLPPAACRDPPTAT